MSSEASVSFRDLLAYTDFLANRWLNYFRQHPEALEINVGGRIGTLRALVDHIFAVEQTFADRLHGKEVSYPKVEAPGLEKLEANHRQAQAELTAYVAAVSEGELGRVAKFGPVTVSNRKVLTQTVLHSVHHWAQVAMEVRQAGFPTEKPQDIIISPVME
ncbi:MAG TPA: DinB family protein [Terriglobales bacterium]|jgi:uncharacterized damage-inducible protein DinB